ncbi:MAG: nucleotide exchange factor GrpE [Saprospiraceae bacterium]
MEKDKKSMESEGMEDQILPDIDESASTEGENVAINNEPDSLEEELQKLKEQNAELKDKYLRIYAEFDNFRKRSMKEKMEFMQTAARDTMSALLPVLDDFDRAKKIAEQPDSKEVFSEGVALVYQKLYVVLSGKGLKKMESTGVEFDAELHEAVTEVPAPTEDLKGKVVDTLEEGYLLNDKIIRYAKVVTGK